MLRLYQDRHFDFRCKTVPGDYLNPILTVELKPQIVEWLDEHGFGYALHRLNQASEYFLILEIDLELCSPDAEMLFKLTWL